MEQSGAKSSLSGMIAKLVQCKLRATRTSFFFFLTPPWSHSLRRMRSRQQKTESSDKGERQHADTALRPLTLSLLKLNSQLCELINSHFASDSSVEFLLFIGK